MIRPRLILAAALALPLCALAAVWAVTHRQAQEGQDWLVPIEGYDPRDLLRGHYVQYRHAWPMTPAADGQGGGDRLAYASSLCLHGRAPHIASVTANPGEGDRCAIIVKAQWGTRREVRGLDTGLIYLSQPRALALSRQLADPKQQGFVRVRIRPDGVMRPVDLLLRARAGER